MKKVIITMPIRNRDWCISNVLNSIKDQTYNLKDIGLYFLLNDSTDNTEKILTKFKNDNEQLFREIIIETKNMGEMELDDHIWNKTNYSRISKLRNECLKQIKDYDYLLMLDSDTCLNPNVIKHLVELDKDVITENGWATWNTVFGEVYPYVTTKKDPLNPDYWLLDDSIDILRKPGTYKFTPNRHMRSGGCVLIKRNVIESGVDYTPEFKNPITLLQYQDELTVFSHNLQKHGYDHWIDTHYECYTYEQYEPKNLVTTISHDLYTNAIDFLKKAGVKTVIDVGTGVGYGMNMLSKYFKVRGIEKDRNVYKQAILNYPKLKIDNIDMFHYNNEKADAVISCELIEHIPFLRDYFNKLRSMTKEHGYVFISTPNSELFEKQPAYHIHRFTKKVFENICSEYIVGDCYYLYEKNEYTNNKTLKTNLMYFGKWR